MIEFHPDIEHGVVELQVKGKLNAQDFAKAAAIVDPLIEAQGKVKGLLVCISEFKGWEDLHGFLSHMKFVKHHHQFIKRIAAVGNHDWLKLLPSVAKIFVKAEPRYFDINDINQARAWLRENN